MLVLWHQKGCNNGANCPYKHAKPAVSAEASANPSEAGSAGNTPNNSPPSSAAPSESGDSEAEGKKKTNKKSKKKLPRKGGLSTVGHMALGLVAISRSAMAFNANSCLKDPAELHTTKNVTLGMMEEHQWYAEKHYWPDFARKWYKCKPHTKDSNHQHSVWRRALDPIQNAKEA